MRRHLRRMRQTLDWGICNSRLARCVDFWGLLTKVSRTRSTVSADGTDRPVRFAAHMLTLCWNFMYHSRIVWSVGSSVWYMVRNLRCTVTITDHHNLLSFGKFQDTESSLISCPRHVSLWLPLAVKTASTPRRLVNKKTWRHSLLLDMLLSAVSVLVVAQPSSEVPEGLINYPAHLW